MSRLFTLVLDQGDEVTLTVTVSDVNGLVDLSGLTGTALHYRAGVRGHEAMLEYQIGSGIVVTDGPAGVCTVTLLAAHTALLEPDLTLRHELRLTTPTIKRSVFKGTLTVGDSLMVAD